MTDPGSFAHNIIMAFVAGINLMALIVATVYGIAAYQTRRCSTHTTKFDSLISVLFIRQQILADKAGVRLPSADEIDPSLKRGQGDTSNASMVAGCRGECNGGSGDASPC